MKPLINRKPDKERLRAAMLHQKPDKIPYWEGLMTEWVWTKRKKKEELAVLGAETLGKLGTPAAIASLAIGAKKGSAAVRQACATALSQAQRQHRGNPSLEPIQ